MKFRNQKAQQVLEYLVIAAVVVSTLVVFTRPSGLFRGAVNRILWMSAEQINLAVDELCVGPACGGSCGNGICEASIGEICESLFIDDPNECQSDCGLCPVCGAGGCELGESCDTCPADCGVCPSGACDNDGICDAGENYLTCPGDCDIPECGNGVQNDGEACDTGEFVGSPPNYFGDTCANYPSPGGPNYYMDCGFLICNAYAAGPGVACTANTDSCCWCGDGIINGTGAEAEDCDGGELGGMDCLSLDMGFDGGVLGCYPPGDAQECHYDTSACWDCGNGVLELGEACEPGPPTGVLCPYGDAEYGCYAAGTPEECQFDASLCGYCGDEIRNGPEQCDNLDHGGQDCFTLGHAGGGELACVLPGSPGQCTFDESGCIDLVCGDGFITNPPETCDPLADPVFDPPVDCEDIVNRCGDASLVTCDPVACEPVYTACSLCGDGECDPCEMGWCAECAASDCDFEIRHFSNCLHCGPGVYCENKPLLFGFCEQLNIGDCNCPGGEWPITNVGVPNTVVGDCDTGAPWQEQYHVTAGYTCGPYNVPQYASQWNLGAVVPCCGDDIPNGGEDCDGNTANCDILPQYDGGMLSCHPGNVGDALECHWIESACFACGDGNIDIPTEECDTNTSGPGPVFLPGAVCEDDPPHFGGAVPLECDANCQIDYTSCFWCGDGSIDAPEVCDGLQLDGKDCETEGFDGGALVCAGDCLSFDTSGCYRCGDGAVDIANGEECDWPDMGALPACEDHGLPPGVLGCYPDGEPLECRYDTSMCGVCGDMTVSAPEECEPSPEDLNGEDCTTLGMGFTDGNLNCFPVDDPSGNECRFDTSACTTCGNGTWEGLPYEECDTLQFFPGAVCEDEPPYFGGAGPLVCDGNCQIDYTGCLWCGDGSIDGTENCDDLGPTFQAGINQCSDIPGYYGPGPLGCSGCDYDTSQCDWCGNGDIDAGFESCDPSAAPVFDPPVDCQDIPGRCGDASLVACDPVACTVDYTACSLCGDGECDPCEMGWCPGDCAADNCYFAISHVGPCLQCGGEYCEDKPLPMEWGGLCEILQLATCNCPLGQWPDNAEFQWETNAGNCDTGEPWVELYEAAAGYGCVPWTPQYATRGVILPAQPDRVYVETPLLPCCGDGEVTVGESCDENSGNCITDVVHVPPYEGGTLTCNADCTWNENGCYFCGDGNQNPGEECDGNDFGVETCLSRRGMDGNLICRPDCTIDDSMCGIGECLGLAAARVDPHVTGICEATVVGVPWPDRPMQYVDWGGQCDDFPGEYCIAWCLNLGNISNPDAWVAGSPDHLTSPLQFGSTCVHTCHRSDHNESWCNGGMGTADCSWEGFDQECVGETCCGDFSAPEQATLGCGGPAETVDCSSFSAAACVTYMGIDTGCTLQPADDFGCYSNRVHERVITVWGWVEDRCSGCGCTLTINTSYGATISLGNECGRTYYQDGAGTSGWLLYRGSISQNTGEGGCRTEYYLIERPVQDNVATNP